MTVVWHRVTRTEVLRAMQEYGLPRPLATASRVVNVATEVVATDRFHIVAPDLPGFGRSDMPARSSRRHAAPRSHLTCGPSSWLSVTILA